MNLQRIQQLAGIKLNESVQDVPGIGKSKNDKNLPMMLKHQASPHSPPRSADSNKEHPEIFRKQAFEEDYDMVDEKSTSEKQARMMAAIAHGWKKPGGDGPSKSVAKEFNKADTGTSRLSNAMKKEECAMSMEEELNGTPDVVSCNQSNPENARDACHMEEDYMYQMEEDNDKIKQAVDLFSSLVNHSFVDPDVAYDRVTRELLQQEGGEVLVAQFQQALEDEGFTTQQEMNADDDDIIDRQGQPYSDFADQPENTYDRPEHDPAESPFDYEDQNEFDEAFDLNNGYDDINDANGQDYFPSGADSPVVRGIGGNARSGDNPEQKRVAVAEVHKELVYNYRKYLGETSSVTDYNPKSQGGTRKELLAKYKKSKSSKDAEAARKAGATQDELKSCKS